MIVDGERHTQLLRGALDMCLLALLGRAAAHGYDLVRRLDAAGIEGVGYGTVYPLLTRLRKLGYVEDELHDSPAGPPRKVYALTGDGQAALKAWQEQWAAFTATVDAVLADEDRGS